MSLTFTEEQLYELARWRDTLRETTIKQTQRVLRNHYEKCCCLGVYCHISPIGQWIDLNEGDLMLEHKWAFETGCDHSELSPPHEVRKQLGLHQVITVDHLGRRTDRELAFVFTQLNDEHEWTFHQIADEIDYMIENKTLSPLAQDTLRWYLVEDN